MKNSLSEIYCWHCGQKHVAIAKICVHCGCESRCLDNQFQEPGQKKNKATAVVLAVFLSWWTWLYTSRHDMPKFLTSLFVTMFVTMPMIAMFVLCFDSPNAWLSGVAILVCGVINSSLWIWAVLGTSTRSKSWYSEAE